MMLQPEQPSQITTPPTNGKPRKRGHEWESLRAMVAMQKRICTLALTAKPDTLCALVKAFDLLEERKRIRRGHAHPDIVGKLSRKGPRVPGQSLPDNPCPEPEEPRATGQESEPEGTGKDFSEEPGTKESTFYGQG